MTKMRKIILLKSLLLMCLMGNQAVAIENQSHAKGDYAHYQSTLVKTPVRTIVKTQVNSQNAYRSWSSPRLSQRSERHSRCDVMNEEKKRYDAKVLKISLNAKTSTYNVRILLPSGKVRNVKISAQK